MLERSGNSDFERRAREAGIRVTRPRQAIWKVLAEADDYPNAVEIFHRASTLDSDVSLPTVYRTLKILEAKGVIQRHVAPGKPWRFKPVGDGPHDHLTDIETGELLAFSSDQLVTLLNEAARSLGYELTTHRLTIYGRKRRA